MTSRTKVNMARTALLALQGEGGSPSAVGGARKSHIEAADSAHIYTWGVFFFLSASAMGVTSSKASCSSSSLSPLRSPDHGR